MLPYRERLTPPHVVKKRIQIITSLKPNENTGLRSTSATPQGVFTLSFDYLNTLGLPNNRSTDALPPLSAEELVTCVMQ
jgi:hypothetical protein